MDTSPPPIGMLAKSPVENAGTMGASSLSYHLVDIHEIYQGQVVAKELLEGQEGMVYWVDNSWCSKFYCPFPLCKGELASGWMMWHHFRDLHPLKNIIVPKEGRYLHCSQSGMQVNPRYPSHINTNGCWAGIERRH